jgi:multidrug resistance efflux pump
MLQMKKATLAILGCFIISIMTQAVFAVTLQLPQATENSRVAKVESKKDKTADSKKSDDPKKESLKKNAEPKKPDKKELDKKKKASCKKSKTKAAVKKDSKKKPPEKKVAEKKNDPAATDPKPKDSQKEPSPETFTVVKKPFQKTIQLKAVVESRKMTPISIKPELWDKYTVLTAVDHGTHVNRGDLLVSFDPEKIDEAIADLRDKLKIAELELNMSSEKLKAVRKVAKLEQRLNKNEEKIAKEDRQYWFDVELKASQKMVDFYLEMMANNLDYHREELRQLEKMYAEDELTEETEEIVLRRTRDQVKLAEFRFEQTKRQLDRMRKTALPRQSERIKSKTEQQLISIAQKEVLQPIELKMAELSFKRDEIELKRQRERLEKTLIDRKLMTVKSPVSGIVYYGRYVHSRWSNGSTTSIDPGTSVQRKKIFMTIVQPEPICLRACVEEKEFWLVRPGLAGVAVAPSAPLEPFGVSVERVSEIPAGSSFEAVFSFASKKGPTLYPGMTCQVTLVGYQKKNSLLIPTSSVETDPLDQRKQYVFKPVKKGKPKKIRVKLGHAGPKGIEVLSGLKAGEIILKEAPTEDGNEAKSKPKGKKSATAECKDKDQKKTASKKDDAKSDSKKAK